MVTDSFLLWTLLPYLCLATFVLGHLWRYQVDKFGWTTRSSQSYESKLLQIGSPLFHFGMLGVIMGHVVGILVPENVTAFVGVSEHLYHLSAIIGGGLAAVMTVVGLALLIYRRVKYGAVRRVTTTNDKVMYLALATVIILGCTATVMQITATEYNYREGVSPWFRSLFYLNPKPELITHAPLIYRAHALCAWLLIALWPFTRLVHLFSAPIGYLTRPYVVYRSRPAQQVGHRPTRRGWDLPH